jgi:acetyl esterase/lipase
MAMTTNERLTPNERLLPDLAHALGDFGFGDLDAELLPAYRAGFEMPGSDGVARVDHVVPGDTPVPLRVHRTRGDDRVRPCVYGIHGGGYVLGNSTMDNPLFDRLCPDVGVVGVSVDYRLAPETPYPGPLEDCYRGLLWTFAHADELGVDATCIGVMGGSAGGGLAAALALLVRDRGEVQLAFQLLDCPMLDDRQHTQSSQEDGLPVWSRHSNTFGWRSYLGDLYGRDDVPATAAPARATDLTGLPPAFIAVGAVDGFLDEDVDYALRLTRACVPTELHVYPGACHGFQLLAPDAAVTKQWARDQSEWLARQLPAPMRR